MRRKQYKPQYNSSVLVHVIEEKLSGQCKSLFHIKMDYYYESLIILIKSIPVSDRKYDYNTKVWTITQKYWSLILSYLQINNIYFEQRIAESDKPVENNPEYEKYKKLVEEAEQAVTAKPTESRETIEAKFRLLLPEELRSLPLQAAYRKAAFLYHPDRQNGNSSKMSEINELYAYLK